MPNVVRYVDTDADAGGDGTTSATSSGDNTHAYDSLANFITGEGSIGNNVVMYVYCNRGTTTPRDTTAADFSAMSFGNTSSRLHIRPNDTDYDPYTGADNTSYHYGVYDTGYVVFTSSNSTNTVKIADYRCTIAGIEIRNDPPTLNSGTGLLLQDTTASTTSDMIIRSTGGTYASVGIKAYANVIENCIVDHYGGGSAATQSFLCSNYGNVQFKNCLAANSNTGFYAQVTGGTDPQCINCVAYNCTNDYVDGGGGWDTTNSTNCATTDSSAAESWVTVTSVSTTDAVDFTAPSTKDWTLTSGGALTDPGSSNGTAVDIALVARS